MRPSAVKALLAPLFIAIVLVVAWSTRRPALLVRRAVTASDTDRVHRHVDLVQKDGDFHPLIDGAHGRVDYIPQGTAFAFRLHGTGLAPGKRYLLELEVDSTIYAVASHVANDRGELTIDTTLSRFAEGVCVGKKYDPPRPLSGHHEIRFWVKRDGNPKTGSASGAPPGSEGASLPCAGNGDGDYSYVLLEQQLALFTGEP